MREMARVTMGVACRIWHKPTKLGWTLLGYLTFVIAVILFAFQIGGILEENAAQRGREQSYAFYTVQLQAYQSELTDYRSCLSRIETRAIIRSLFIALATTPSFAGSPESESFQARLNEQYPDLSPEECILPTQPSQPTDIQIPEATG